MKVNRVLILPHQRLLAFEHIRLLHPCTGQTPLTCCFGQRGATKEPPWLDFIFHILSRSISRSLCTCVRMDNRVKGSFLFLWTVECCYIYFVSWCHSFLPHHNQNFIITIFVIIIINTVITTNNHWDFFSLIYMGIKVALVLTPFYG